MEYSTIQKKKFNATKIFLGCFILAFSVIGLIAGFFYLGVIPIPDEEKIISGKKQNYRPVGNASDPENSTGEVFSYVFNAPENSFGIKEFKIVNWSYWKDWLRSMFKWRTTASPNMVDWYNADQAMKINIDWDKTNITAKVTLTLNTSIAPTSLYYRFELAVNRSIKDYINKSSNYEYWLSLPANNSEDYNIFFNWSDLKPLVDSGKITIKHKIAQKNNQSFYYFNITTVNKIAPDKEFIIDPVFGETSATGYNANAFPSGTYKGIIGSPASDGYADNISVYLGGASPSVTLKAGLYNSDLSFYASTEEVEWGQPGNGWCTLDFVSPPFIDSDNDYYISFFFGDTIVAFYKSGGSGRITGTNTYPNWEDPADSSDTSFTYVIYCSYTAGGVNPSWNNPFDFNMSFSNSSTLRTWNNIFDFNFSFSNTTGFYNPFSFNFSFSNITGFYNPFDFNFSFSNTSIRTWNNIFDFNFSFSNSSAKGYKNYYDFNFSFSNSSAKGYKNYYDFNFSFSNTTSWGNPFSFNFSFSNTTVRTWNNPFDFNFSFSNLTGWGNPFSFNFSFSNSTPPFPILVTIIYPAENETGIPLQPTLVIIVNHSQGSLMNVTWYYGLSAGAENILIGSDLNIYNSTVTELFYQADNWATQYFLRAYINDGNESINTTWSFYTGLSGQVYISTDIFAVVLIVFLVAAGVFIYIIWRARRKQNENQPPNDPYNIYK